MGNFLLLGGSGGPLVVKPVLRSRCTNGPAGASAGQPEGGAGARVLHGHEIT